MPLILVMDRVGRRIAVNGCAEPVGGRRRSSALRGLAILLAMTLMAVLFPAARASAASCYQATSGGAAPADWATYCWLDFSAYNEATAKAAGGQAFSFSFNDGSVLTLTAHVTSTAANALRAITAPSWTGSAVGNTAFLGIGGKPILYTATNATTVTVSFTNIQLTSPPGVSGGSTYSFIAADGESTNTNESLQFTTNGGNWLLEDQVPPSSGSAYPSYTNTGTVFTETGAAGTVGAYIVGSLNATTVTTTLVAGGLQGAMFALRYATISLNESLVGGRANAADQFTYTIGATSPAVTLGTATSTGAANGLSGQTSSFLTTLQSLTVSESMAAGSVSTLAAYAPSLTCTNAATGSPTTLPTNLVATSDVIPSIAFGDSISCVFTNTRRTATLSVAKSAPTPGLKVGVNSVYTLTVTNSGQGATTTAQVKDQLPANLTYVSASGTHWICSNVSALITCTYSGGSIPAGGTSAIAVTVTAPIAAAGVSDTNYASIDPAGGSAAPAPGPACAPSTSCANSGASLVIYVNPAPETGTTVAGTPSTAIVNVGANDTVNGAAAVFGSAGNATVAQSGNWPVGLTLSAAGAVSTTAAVLPGSYSLTYQLCDKSTPVNCATATDTVTVSAHIVANPASGTAVSGTSSTPIVNVAATDTVNGAAAVLGSAGNATVAQSGAWRAGITLDGAGGVNTTAGVPPGIYSLPYQLCDINTPANCATATDTVTVSAHIVANTASGTASAGTASTPIASVVSSDTVNGAVATLGVSGNATVAQSGTWPAGITLNVTTGAISTSTAVARGTYALIYQLCDKNSPVNCATATDTVNVSSTLVATAATGTAVAGTASTAITNVAAADTINGAAATLGPGGNATVAQSGTWPAGITLNPATGAITTIAAAAPGTYSLVYQLCDRSTPPNCVTATDTVHVTANLTALPAAGTALAGTPATPIANVAAGDSVNGVAATLGAAGNATVAQVGSWPAGLALTPATGAVSTTAAVAPGTYTVAYQLCDRNTPVDCTTANDTITVTASIVPAVLSGTAVAGTPSTPIGTVAANGTVNGAAAALGTAGNATVAPVGTWPVGVTLNPATGAVSTTAAVGPGTYSVGYQLCDKATPPHCATAIDTVKVGAAILPAAASGTAITGSPSTPIGNVAAGGTINGVAATLGSGGNATIATSGSWPAGFALNTTTGAITTSAALPAGNYTLPYQLCDRNSPANCSIANDTVRVASTVAPAPASGTAMAGIPSTPVPDVIANATVAGAPATLGPAGNATIAVVGSWPAGFAFDTTTGAITTTAAVARGNYQLRYQLCDRLTPPTCVTAIATVVVGQSSGGVLLVDKQADKMQAAVGDSVQYRIHVRNTGTGAVAGVALADSLPLGFKLIPGTVQIGIEPAQPVKAADPQGSPGPMLTFPLGPVFPGAVIDIYYQVRLGVGADRGNGINSAQALGAGVSSSIATAQVQVTGDAFATSACLVGKIFLDCNGNQMQDAGELGIPGVRLYFEDGTNLTSDENGDYSICGQRPITHVLKVDAITLPVGSRLAVLSSRNAGNGNSLFVDLRDGELHRADFAEGTCTPPVMAEVERRRRHGPVFTPLPPVTPAHGDGIDFDSKLNRDAR